VETSSNVSFVTVSHTRSPLRPPHCSQCGLSLSVTRDSLTHSLTHSLALTHSDLPPAWLVPGERFTIEKTL